MTKLLMKITPMKYIQDLQVHKRTSGSHSAMQNCTPSCIFFSIFKNKQTRRIRETQNQFGMALLTALDCM